MPMPKRFIKPLPVLKKQEMILDTFELKENDCVRIRTDIPEFGGSREDDYKIIKLENKGYVLSMIGGEYIAPLTKLLTDPWVKVQPITEFGNCKCEDVDCKECPLLYISYDCAARYNERFNNCKYCNEDTYSNFNFFDVQEKRNVSLYKSTVRDVYGAFIATTYPSKYKCLINWNAVVIELGKATDVVEENGVTYFKKRELKIEEDEFE